MNRYFTYAVIIILLTSSLSYAGIPGKADTVFAGIVTYSMSYDFTPGMLRNEELIKKQAKEVEFIFRGNQSKRVMEGSELKQVTFANGYDKTVVDILYVYEDKAGKFGVPYGGVKKEFRDVQVELAQTPPPKVEFTNETKVIQELTCKKAIITTYDLFGMAYTSDVYYYEHPDLDNLYFNTEFRSIKGLLMEFEFVSQGIIVKFKASEFKQKKKIKDKEFELPEEVEYYTLEELNKINQRGYE